MVSRTISTLLTLPLTVLCGLFERFCPKIFVNISWRVDCTVLVTVVVPVLPCTTLSSAISTAVEQYSVFMVLPKMSLYFLWGEISRFWFVNFLLHFLARGTVSRDTSHCTLGNCFANCSMFLCGFISFSHFSQRPEKQKSAAQNRTKTTNCPNSVSYGAWKFFSPYGSCSACTIGNRFALFGFHSVSAASAFDNMIIRYTSPKKQELYFSLRMRVRIFRLIVKYKSGWALRASSVLSNFKRICLI